MKSNNSKSDQALKLKKGTGLNIDFLKYGVHFAVFSFICVGGSLLDIVIGGFNYGIDFKGGTEIQVQFEKGAEASELRSLLATAGYENAQVQKIGDNHEFLLRIDLDAKAQSDSDQASTFQASVDRVTSTLMSSFQGQEVSIRRVDTVGPVVGSELKRNSLLAIFYSLLLILIYVGLRFDYKFAPGAVFCVFHDAIVTLGVFAVFNLEVNVQTLAAVLTVIGYSLNDTIVIFDRIRENLTVHRDQSFTWICNRSMNDSLSRTLLTTSTTLLAVGAMYFIAGGVIQDFSLALGIGLILGTYSTMYVATPLVIFFDRLETKQKHRQSQLAQA